MRKRHLLALSCLLILLSAVASAPTLAFLFPPPAPTLQNSPLVATPDSSVTLSVYDVSYMQLIGPYSLVDKTVSIHGNQIDIGGRVVAGSTSSPSNDSLFIFEVGKLPPNRYTVTYTGFTDDLRQDIHRAVLEFTVSTRGYLIAVEYFNQQLGHYFVTVDANEIAKLDADPQHWKRTGEGFYAIAVEDQPFTADHPNAGTTPVCRFYGLPSAGLDSHFFSADPSECARVQKLFPTQWLLETPEAFGMTTEVLRWCGVPIYRFYNNQRDVNHRLTKSKAIRDEMLARGWLPEGNQLDSDGVRYSMCSPSI